MMVQERKSLHLIMDDGSLITRAGYLAKILEILRNNFLEFEIRDFRTPMPPPDFAEVGRVLKLRDYQIEPMAQLLLNGVNDNGYVAATGGFGG